MATASIVMSPAHLKLLQLVYDSFKETGTWPSALKVRLAIRKNGELADLTRELGPHFILGAAGERAQEKCELRCRSLVHLRGAERDRGNFEAVIPYLVTRYIETEGEAKVTTLEFEQQLGMTTLEARRLVAWLHYAPRLLRSMPSDPEMRGEMTLSADILRLEGVINFAEYLKRTDELDEEQWKRWAEQQSRPPRPLPRRELRLGLGATNEAFGLDLVELHAELRSSKVEELFVGEHYGEAVRNALTLLEVRVRDMVASRLPRGEKVPRGVNLMGKAFSVTNPVIRLNAGVTDTERSEQQGFQFLAQGAMAWPRNYLSHELPEMEPSEALAWLGLVSMLMKRLDAVSGEG